MNTRILMTASSLFLGLAGLFASFAPQELLTFLDSPAAGLAPVLVQLMGALYFSYALVNWAAKDSLIGGIYSRPVSLGNMAHFLIGALVLAKSQSVGLGNGTTLVLLVVYVVFAVLFGGLVFGRGAAGKVAKVNPAG
ncbi:MAG TPA: hypothetical protein VF789_00820 [Thermoanaerobaculia bacterium]